MKPIHRKSIALFASALCAAVVNPSLNAADKVTFDQHVLPILRDKCLSCHDADKARGGLDVSTYGKLMEGGSSGPVVKAGDAEGSRFYLLVAHKDEPKMPPKSDAIAASSQKLIKDWIDGGAPENAGSKTVVIAKKVDMGVKAPSRARPAVAPMPLARLSVQPLIHSPRANAVTALAASPWAPLAAVAAPKQVLLYNTDTLDLVGVLPFAHGQINVLRFSRGGEVLLAAGGRGGKSGKAVLYDIKTGGVVTEVGDETDAVLAADLSPDQTMVATGGPGRTVRVYATADGAKLREIKKHTEWVTSVEFSPDGVLLASADRNGGLAVWEANNGREYLIPAGHKTAITDLSWRSDSNVLATCGEDGAVRLWEMENGAQIKAWGAHGGGVQSVKYSPDGRLVTCGRDGKARLFDGNGGAQREFAGIGDVATKVAVTHDSSLVLAGNWAGVIHAFATANGKSLGQATTNPPPLEERLDRARAELVARKRVAEIAEELFKDAAGKEQAARAQADASSKSAAAAQQAAAAAQTAATNAAKGATDLETTSATLSRAEAAAQIKLKSFTVAFQLAQSEAAKAGNDPAIAKAVADVKKSLDDAAAELTRVQTERQRVLNAMPGAKQHMAATQKTAADSAAALKAAQDSAANSAAAVPRAAASTAAAKLLFDRTVADRETAKSALERLQSAAVPKP